MPAISKIRFTNVVYEDGNKRYNDETFHFDGHNGAILLENGGGKTVFIQAALQAVLPHEDLAGRKVKETFALENGPAHVAIEWIIHERPRRYAVTCVTLFLTSSGLDSIRYVYDYPAHDPDAIDEIPLVRKTGSHLRPADKGEMQDYYQAMCSKRVNAHTFPTRKSYHQYLEEQLHIIPAEWSWIAKINQSEGGIEHFFDECKTTTLLFDRLLIPVVEASMTGYTEGGFAATFQTHRDSFKKYKELKEKVEENKRILSELNSYVEASAKLHQKQTAYSSLQSEAKAYWQAAHREEEAQLNELERLEEQIQDWKNRSALLSARKDSLHIARLSQQLEATRNKLELVEDDKRMLEEELGSAEREYHSLRYADYRSQRLQAEERARASRAKLERLEQTEDESELERAWERNSGQILYLLTAAMERLTEQKQGLEQEIITVQSRLQSDEQVLKRLEAEHREQENACLKLAAGEEEKERQREEIRKQVLANPAMENIEDKQALWIKRHTELDDSIVKLTQHNKELVSRKGKEQQQYELIHAQARDAAELCSRLGMQLEQQQQAHQSILLELKALRPAWERLPSVYDRQSSIVQQLKEDLEKLGNDKERQLQLERLAFRFVDDYAEQHYFFAEPILAALLQKWSPQFTVLKTGAQYLEEIGVSAQELRDGLWSVTVITLEEDQAGLCQKLLAYAEQFQYPVRVINTSEASMLVQGQADKDSGVWVEPKHWQSNTDRNAFAEWKRVSAQSAQRSREERLQLENEIRRWEGVYQGVQRFIDEYPLEWVQQFEEQLRSVKEQIRQLDQEAGRLKASMDRIDELHGDNVQKMSDHKDEWNQLHRWIEQGQKYIALGKEIQLLRSETDHRKEQMLYLQGQLHRYKRSAEALKKQADQLGSDAKSLEDQLRSLQEQELYVEVRRYASVVTEEHLDRLKIERSDLFLRKQRVSQGRRELEVELNAALDKQLTMDNEMARLESEHPELMKELEFPVNGKRLMEELLGSIRLHKEKENRLNSEYARIHREYVQQETKVNLMVEQYTKTHQGEQPIQFLEPLSEVAEQVVQGEGILGAEKKELDRLQTQLQSWLAQVRKAIAELTPYKLLHGFENPLVAAAALSDAAITDFSYNRPGVVKDVTGRLDAGYQAVELEAKQLHKAADRFKAFCRKQIKDVKMREMAEQGVEQARTHDDAVAFQQSMQTRIHRANHIAEETMRTHNQQLEQFIVHVHSHLRQVTAELRDIPNKTRVKTENEWKPIFAFHIPDWEEQEGKGAIRQHLDWIIEQLERDKYMNEHGQELEVTVRKDLEKWLDTKQLLQVVLQDKAMKVSCRKVTNENGLTKAAYAWEQSNNWSGGEKWSKNMTLFLGLLNYTAEKRQHIQAGMKRHRAVILDNPFGKASSDHVLSPVFFIAEQLGFQIIALTAHASGKFLQDYFPIVFSCKLRQAAGSGKQIMTKEKTINLAYFRDHAPQSMERLGDVTQMELF